jgi:dihydropteroate synthase
MGVVNVTPDSFSDGGRYVDTPTAVARIHQLAGEGAAIVDIGAESTRPGAERVSADEQLARALPVLEAATGVAPLSIDTTRAEVADRALDLGVAMVNDVSAGRDDPDILPVVADRGADLCLMHMRGEPGTMQADPVYGDVVAEVRDFLGERVEAAVAAGVPRERIVVDPGIGFGKTLEHNLALLAGLDRIARLGLPVLVGVSRKSMFGALLGRELSDRLVPSVAGALAAVAGGADVVRVHDVRETVDAIAVWRAIEEAGA